MFDDKSLMCLTIRRFSFGSNFTSGDLPYFDWGLEAAEVRLNLGEANDCFQHSILYIYVVC
jgi:hypothetical protein